MTTEEQATPRSVTPDPILQLALGYMASKHLFVANEIGLFHRLAAGPATLDELAQRTGVPRRTVRISVDAMVALGLVERHGEQYQNGPVAAAYLSGQGPVDMRPMLRYFTRISYPTWGQLEEVVRAGQAPNRQGGGFSEADQRLFSEGVEAFTAGPAQALAPATPSARTTGSSTSAAAPDHFSSVCSASTRDCRARCLSWRAPSLWRASAWPASRRAPASRWWWATSSRTRFLLAMTRSSLRISCICSCLSRTARCCSTHAHLWPKALGCCLWTC